jgi:hypothetical protein
MPSTATWISLSNDAEHEAVQQSHAPGRRRCHGPGKRAATQVHSEAAGAAPAPPAGDAPRYVPLGILR